jgi:demethoxyubiquinone hydroxylase (CLK1/Coq7/Cat5 family)
MGVEGGPPLYAIHLTLQNFRENLRQNHVSFSTRRVARASRPCLFVPLYSVIKFFVLDGLSS